MRNSFGGGLAQLRGVELALLGALDELPDDGPGALYEAVGAGDGVLVPVEVLLGRGDEQDDEAHGVGAVGLDDARGGTTLPFDLDMVSPCSSLTMPWHSRLVKGSSKSTMPRSRSTFVQKRL